MNYSIKAFNKTLGSLVVLYWTPEFQKGVSVNISLPFVNGEYPSADKIKEIIESAAPIDILQRLSNTTLASTAVIESLVEQPVKTTEQIAEEARNEVKKNRDEYVSGIKVTTQSGRTFDGDETSQNRMARAIIALNAQPQNPIPTIVWVLADNTNAQVTAAELNEALILASNAQTAIWLV